ncbi:uncharacterized protein BO87DRAFT_431121 [Aspergillus neoniger CBS 115656]|uniref:Uncharacterized protein n=1 Tax=Aspergillus neoniger (strain CBS 115656) TaxID=1448310 RepID=A0A318Y7Y6_ASPNB|nr:hypothetical protein BO87DRAFT_431121 [Aspergillus neoniger CBS 115656]PYH28780.1 hypothetical protein BO87DRAFT_431121 [Aspergillus neoniger CBS 115656]
MVPFHPNIGRGHISGFEIVKVVWSHRISVQRVNPRRRGDDEINLSQWAPLPAAAKCVPPVRLAAELVRNHDYITTNRDIIIGTREVFEEVICPLRKMKAVTSTLVIQPLLRSSTAKGDRKNVSVLFTRRRRRVTATSARGRARSFKSPTR